MSDRLDKLIEILKKKSHQTPLRIIDNCGDEDAGGNYTPANWSIDWEEDYEHSTYDADLETALKKFIAKNE